MNRPEASVVDRVRASPRLREVGWVLLPLRGFLGITFVYAGVLKLTDPTYFDASSPNSVQAQMLRAAHTSPIGPLVTLSAHAAVLTGLVIAFGELAVGLGVLLGLWTRLAALGGLLLSLSFFLTVSWSTRPYFFGSDIVFLFAWTPLVIAGDGGVLSVVNQIRARVRAELKVGSDRSVPSAVSAELERRTVVRTGALAAAVGAATVALGSVSALNAHRRSTSSAAPSPTLSGGGPTPSASASASASATPSASSPQGTVIGPTARVPVGGSASFTDPVGGRPGIVVQPTPGQFKAFSAVCTHAGCTVVYQSGTFFCPCHGSSFDAKTGAVLSGPAPSALPTIPIKVTGGTIFET